MNFFHLLLSILFIIIVNGVKYNGFNQICHQIVQHFLRFYDHGTENTRITHCKLVNIELKYYYDDILEIKIFFNNKPIETLKLYQTDGKLANQNTPVYFSTVVPPINYTNFDSKYFFNASTIHEYTPELSDFNMYHNRNKTASIIVFQGPNSFQVEGNVGNYILRRLPRIPYLCTKYAYIRIKNNHQDEKWNNYVNNTNLSYDLQAPHLNNIIVNLLVVLDSTSVSNTRVEVMRTLLMYFNYIDMFHGNFTSPKIQFSIKGIILPPIDDFIPYLGNNRAVTNYLDSTHIIKTIQTMYKTHNKLFNLDSHDIIAIMTQRPIGQNQPIDDNNAYADDNDQFYISDIYSDYFCKDRKYPIIMTIFHTDFQDYHVNFLDALTQFLGYQEKNNETLTNCTAISQESIMNYELKYPLAWSAYDIQQYSDQFRKFNCSHLEKSTDELM